MIGPSTVLIEAVVRSRDGRSILDWNPSQHGSESVKTYAPDPTRVKAAIATLEAGGAEVLHVGDFAITFQAPANVVTSTTGASLTPSSSDDGGWELANDESGWFEVPANLALSASVHGVILSQPAQPYALRNLSNPPDPVGTDLLLGEVGPSLLGPMPVRLAGPDPVVRSQLDARSAQSITDWHRGAARYLCAWGSSKPGTPEEAGAVFSHSNPPDLKTLVGVRIVESGVPENLKPMLTAHRLLDAGNSTFAVTGSRANPYALLRALHNSTIATYAQEVSAATALADQLGDAVRKLIDGRQGSSDETEGSVRTNWPQVGNLVEAVCHVLSAVMTILNDDQVNDSLAAAGLANGTDVLRGWTAEEDRRGDLEVLQPDAFKAATNALKASRPRRIAPLLEDCRRVTDRLKAWLAARQAELLPHRRAAESSANSHAAMVVFAFQSVLLGTVPLQLVGSGKKSDSFWTASQPGRRMVSSGSFGVGFRTLSSGSTLSEWDTQWAIEGNLRLRAERIDDPLSLYVLAVGNQGNDDNSPSQNLSWSGHDSVLLVGGCEPVPLAAQAGAQRWAATEATHGYRYVSPASGGFDLTVPDVTAPTQGELGGGVIYPVPVSGDAFKWALGSGSSQSAPIVAAVAALVWQHNPMLTSADVKRAVVNSASRVESGHGFLPTVKRNDGAGRTTAPGVEDGSNEFDSLPGQRWARRVRLDDALRAGRDIANEELAGYGHPLLTPPIPPELSAPEIPPVQRERRDGLQRTRGRPGGPPAPIPGIQALRMRSNPPAAASAPEREAS